MFRDAAISATRRIVSKRLVITGIQAGLARRIGAAGKAIVYQWESKKRTPSPVLWQRVLRLERRDPRRAEVGAADAPSSGMRNMVGPSHRSDADQFESDLG